MITVGATSALMDVLSFRCNNALSSARVCSGRAAARIVHPVLPNKISGPSCSKLTTSLVKVTLKFQTYYT